MKIKNLRWVYGPSGSYTEVAESPFGHYSVWEINGVGCWSPWKQGHGSIAEGGLAGAKVAAQEDFESKVRECIE